MIPDFLTNLALIIILNVVVYYRTLFYAYVGDDTSASKPKPIPYKFYPQRIYHFLRMRCIYDPVEAHAVVLVIHTIVCCLIYWVFGANKISFMAAMLFAVNPANTDCSIWISGRYYSISTLLCLLIYKFPVLLVVWFIIPLSICANSLLFPLVLLISIPWIYAIPVMIIFGLVLYFVGRRVYNRKKSKTVTDEMTTLKPKKLILFVKVYGYYFRMGLTAWRLGMYHNLIYGIGLNKKYQDKCYELDKDFWIGLVIIYIVATNLIFNPGPLSLGLWWFTISITMWCHLVTIQKNISGYYLYMANVGLMLIVANMINEANIPWLFPVVFTAYLIRLWYYMPAFRNDYFQTEYNLMEQPECIKARTMRALNKFKLYDIQGAYYDYMVAYHYCDYDFKINFNVANMALALGNIKEAIEFTDKASKVMYEHSGIGEERELIAELYQNIKEFCRDGYIDMKKVRVLK